MCHIHGIDVSYLTDTFLISTDIIYMIIILQVEVVPTSTAVNSSPYFLGCKLWDKLPLDYIELPDIFSFKKRLKAMDRVYVDLL